MKKTMILLLAVMFLLLCACMGSPTSSNVEKSAEKTEVTVEQTMDNDSAISDAFSVFDEIELPMESEIESIKEQSRDEITAGQSEEGEDISALAEEDIWNVSTLFSLGTLNGDTYENTILGYGCTLPEWVYADEEYIAKLNDVAYSTLSEDAIELVKDYEGFTDMYAESPDGTNNININYQSMNAVQAILLDEETIAAEAISELEMLETSGYENLAAETIKIDIAGEEHYGVCIAATIEGIPIYQKSVVVKCGEYGDFISFITVTSFISDNTDDVLSCFYKLS